MKWFYLGIYLKSYLREEEMDEADTCTKVDMRLILGVF